jgi:hypothetical protein
MKLLIRSLLALARMERQEISLTEIDMQSWPLPYLPNRKTPRPRSRS